MSGATSSKTAAVLWIEADNLKYVEECFAVVSRCVNAL
jgi:hypothetical protein